MLDQIQYRRISAGQSVRELATELGISHTLLSLILNERRKPSKDMMRRFKAWLRTPITVEPLHAPSTVYANFIAEKQAQLAPLTVKFYEAKLAPFILWCEQQMIVDVRNVERHHASAFLSHIRKGRRISSGSRRPLSNGALKLHYQTLKTLFMFVGDTCDVPGGWKNPLDGVKVKGSQSQTMEYSTDEIQKMYEIVDGNTDKVLRLRNRAMLTVLLNSAVRASELLDMDVADVGKDGRVKITGKGSKQRIVTIGKTGHEAILVYLGIRGNWNEALWQTTEGRRLSTDGLRGVLSRIQEQTPSTFSDGVYAHRFRHTAITKLLRARVPLRSVQRYAGHSNPQTTLRYAQAIDADEAIAAVETLTY
jgi:integrase/recombinase XerC